MNYCFIEPPLASATPQQQPAYWCNLMYSPAGLDLLSSALSSPSSSSTCSNSFSSSSSSLALDFIPTPTTTDDFVSFFLTPSSPTTSSAPSKTEVLPSFTTSSTQLSLIPRNATATITAVSTSSSTSSSSAAVAVASSCTALLTAASADREIGLTKNAISNHSNHSSSITTTSNRLQSGHDRNDDNDLSTSSSSPLIDDDGSGSGSGGGGDDDDSITDFLNSNSATAIASSLRSPSASSTLPRSLSLSLSPHSNSSSSSSSSPLVEMLWKPAKARKDTFSMTFPEKMMIRPYKYDLFIRSSQKQLIENMSLEMVFADTLEKPISTKHDVLIENDLLLSSGRLFRFKMNLCSFHFGRRDFRLCIVCGGGSDSQQPQQRFYSGPFRTFARKRETTTTTTTTTTQTTTPVSCLPIKRECPTTQQCDTDASPPPLPPRAEGVSLANKRLKLMTATATATATTTSSLLSTPAPAPCFDATTQIRTIFSAMSSEDKVTFAASLFTLLTPEERGRVV